MESKVKGAEDYHRHVEEVSSLRHFFLTESVYKISCYKSQFPNQTVNGLFVLVIIKNKLTDLLGNGSNDKDEFTDWCGN